MYLACILLELILKIECIKSRIIAFPKECSITLTYNIIAPAYPPFRTVMHTNPNAIIVHEASFAIVKNRELIFSLHFIFDMEIKPTCISCRINIIVQ